MDKAKREQDEVDAAFESFRRAIRRMTTQYERVHTLEERLRDAKLELDDVQESLVDAREELFRVCPHLTMETDELLSDPTLSKDED